MAGFRGEVRRSSRARCRVCGYPHHVHPGSYFTVVWVASLAFVFFALGMLAAIFWPG